MASQEFTERFARRLLGTTKGQAEDTVLWQMDNGTVIPIPRDTPRNIRERLEKEFTAMLPADRVGMASLLANEAGTPQPPTIARNPALQRMVKSNDAGDSLRAWLNIGANVAVIAASMTPYGLVTRLGMIAVPALVAGMTKKGGTLDTGWKNVKWEAAFETGAQAVVHGLGVGPRAAIWAARAMNRIAPKADKAGKALGPVFSPQTMRRWVDEGGVKFTGGIAEKMSLLAAKLKNMPRQDQHEFAVASAQEHLRRIKPKSWQQYITSAKRLLPKNWTETAREKYAKEHLDTFRNLYIGSPVNLARSAATSAAQTAEAEVKVGAKHVEGVEGASFPLWRMLTGKGVFAERGVKGAAEETAGRGGAKPLEAAAEAGEEVQHIVIQEMQKEAGELLKTAQIKRTVLDEAGEKVEELVPFVSEGAKWSEALAKFAKMKGGDQRALLKYNNLDSIQFAEDIVSKGFGGGIAGGTAPMRLGARREAITSLESKIARREKTLRLNKVKMEKLEENVTKARLKYVSATSGKAMVKAKRAFEAAQRKLARAQSKREVFPKDKSGFEVSAPDQGGYINKETGSMQALIEPITQKAPPARKTLAERSGLAQAELEDLQKQLTLEQAKSLTPLRTQYDYRSAAEFARKMGREHQASWKAAGGDMGRRVDAPGEPIFAAYKAVEDALTGKAREGQKAGLLRTYTEDVARLGKGLEPSGRPTLLQEGVPGYRHSTARVQDVHPMVMTGSERATLRKYQPKKGSVKDKAEAEKKQIEAVQELSQRMKELKRFMTLKRITGAAPEESIQIGRTGVAGGMGAATAAGFATLAGMSNEARQAAMAAGGLAGMVGLKPTSFQAMGYGASRGAQMAPTIRRGLQTKESFDDLFTPRRRFGSGVRRRSPGIQRGFY
jgi:hypothetical protein